MSKHNPSATSTWLTLLGIELSPGSHRERLVSALGGLVGVLAVYFASHAIGGPPATPLLIFSIGTLTVLVFAVPHGSLSQFWPVFGGHMVSALISVACARLVPDAALAVRGDFA